MAKKGIQERSNPRYCPSRKLDKLTGRLSSDILQADSIKASGDGTASTGRIHDCKPTSLYSFNNPCILGSVHT